MTSILSLPLQFVLPGIPIELALGKVECMKNGLPVANGIKLFTAVRYKFSQEARVFILGRPFQQSLLFVGKARAYLSEAPYKYSTRVLALQTNIRLGWKSLPWTNALAYYENS